MRLFVDGAPRRRPEAEFVIREDGGGIVDNVLLGMDASGAKYFDGEIAEARALIARHGDEVHNVATDRMIEALREGRMDTIMHWIRLRRCLTVHARRERYTRRLSDKLIWSIEQAFEQGAMELIRTLHAAYETALGAERSFRENRRRGRQDGAG